MLLVVSGNRQTLRKCDFLCLLSLSGAGGANDVQSALRCGDSAQRLLQEEEGHR